MPAYLNDEKKVSELLEKSNIKYANLTEEGARIETDDGRAYVIGPIGLNGLRPYTPDDRSLGSLTGGDIFAQLPSGMPSAAGYHKKQTY